MSGFPGKQTSESVPGVNQHIGINQKKCRNCGETKKTSEFNKDRSKKDGFGNCKECRKKYYKDNKERENQRSKKWREENLELVKQQSRDWREKNSERAKQCCKKWRENNWEYAKQQGRERYKNNLESVKQYNKKWRSNNREYIKQYEKKYLQTEVGKAGKIKKNHKYRALKKGATIHRFNPIDVFSRDRYICQACGCKTRPDYNRFHPKYPNLDHIVPLSKGGEHSIKNAQCLCRQCNIEKSNNQKQDQLLLFGW